MVLVTGKERKSLGNDETDTDSRKRVYHGEDYDEGYLLVVVVDAGMCRFHQKSSPEVRQKPSCGELRRSICGATSGGLKNGPYF
jgi:hypothetical protein